MQHDVQLDGSAFRLRPVRLEDAGFIVELRTGDPNRTKYLHPIPPDISRQREWIAAYLQREHDYYWIIEARESRQGEGAVGIYDMDPAGRSAEWGRWVLRPGSLAAPESVLLVYRAAFEVLNLDSVGPCTIVDNTRVVSFHDSCGLPRTAYLEKHYHLGGRDYDAIRHTCTKEDWPRIRASLERHAALVAARMRESASQAAR